MATTTKGGSLAVGVVGCGEILHDHTTAWGRVRGADLVGLFDLDEELATRRAAQLRGVRPFRSLAALIERCDVVDVCTPPSTHRTIACQALDAGRHVLVEKPVAHTVEDWEAMRAAASVTGARLFAGYQHKFAAHVLRAKRWVDHGRIGETVGVRCDFFVDPSSDPMLETDGHWAHRLPGGAVVRGAPASALPHPSLRRATRAQRRRRQTERTSTERCIGGRRRHDAAW